MRKTTGLFPATVSPRPEHPQLQADILRRQLVERWADTLLEFQREFERVGGTFYRVATLHEVPDLIAHIARERDAHRVVTWHPSALGTDVSGALGGHGLQARIMPPASLDAADDRLRLRGEIAQADVGVTGADLAIAETGTLVLVSGSGRPRSTALLPPYHVALFDRHALVESLEQLGVLLEAWHDGPSPASRGAAIHCITGPSRTADIELTLTRGVHGPREVHAVFVEEGLRG
jgi:L-lactate dehydrogenase complex protein LldG